MCQRVPSRLLNFVFFVVKFYTFQNFQRVHNVHNLESQQIFLAKSSQQILSQQKTLMSFEAAKAFGIIGRMSCSITFRIQPRAI